VPIWLLGSSLFSARLAAALGLPFAFAAHFAPDHLMAALTEYRAEFRPSDALSAPYAMVGVGVVAADTDGEAARLSTSLQQQFLNLRRGMPGLLQPPVDTMEGRWSPAERAGVEHALAYAAVGSRETVHQRLAALIEATAADELIIAGQIFDHRARLHSFEIVSEVRASLSVKSSNRVIPTAGGLT
jgi:luciferase family oxidoreductase group 1